MSFRQTDGALYQYSHVFRKCFKY